MEGTWRGGGRTAEQRAQAAPCSCVCTAGPNVLLNRRRGGRRDIFAWDIHSSPAELRAEVSSAQVHT